MISRPFTAGPLLVVMAILLMPVLYVLSMGPAYGSGYVPARTYNYVYRPVHWLANGTPFGELLRAYVHLWKDNKSAG